jgi:hypothetical protein
VVFAELCAQLSVVEAIINDPLGHFDDKLNLSTSRQGPQRSNEDIFVA